MVCVFKNECLSGGVWIAVGALGNDRRLVCVYTNSWNYQVFLVEVINNRGIFFGEHQSYFFKSVIICCMVESSGLTSFCSVSKITFASTLK